MDDHAEDSITLAANPEGPPGERAWVAELGALVTGRKLEEVQLVVSELVANCLRHAELTADDAIRLWRRLTPGETLRIEVMDAGPGFERPRSVPMPAAGQPGGHGLALADRLADRWGVLRDDAHRVSCEFDRRDDAVSAAAAAAESGSPPAEMAGRDDPGRDRAQRAAR